MPNMLQLCTWLMPPLWRPFPFLTSILPLHVLAPMPSMLWSSPNSLTGVLSDFCELLERASLSKVMLCDDGNTSVLYHTAALATRSNQVPEMNIVRLRNRIFHLFKRKQLYVASGWKIWQHRSSLITVALLVSSRPALADGYFCMYLSSPATASQARAGILK